MLLRFTRNDKSEIVEINRMYWVSNTAHFTLTSNNDSRGVSEIIAPNIDEKTWQRLVSDMFCDGRLSLDSIETKNAFIANPYNL